MKAGAAEREARRRGWKGRVPGLVMVYLGAAKSVMPGVGVEVLLDDLFFHHGEELERRAEGGWRADAEHRGEVLAAMRELREEGVRIWVPRRRQTGLFQ